MRLSTSLAGLALAVCAATASVHAETPASWALVVKAAAVDGTVTKTSGCDGCPDAGARAAVAITTEGYAQYVPAAGQFISAGLIADTSAPIATALDYSFITWPSGAWVVRERGVYRKEGAFVAGDRLSVSVEAGKVVYRKNGVIVYTSAVLPSAPLTFGVILSSAGASISNAVIGLGPVPWAGAAEAPPPPPPPPPAVILPSGLVSAGPYRAIIERQPHARPALPALGPAGTSFADPVFKSKIVRITDAATRPGRPNRSYRTPSTTRGNAWSANGSYFYIVSGDGSVIPFAFDAETGSARRLQPTATDDGGLVLKFYIEPQFSYVNDSLIYGSVTGMSGATLRTIDQYDFSSRLYTRLLDLDALVPGLAGTYIGGIVSSGGPAERVGAFFGGTAQDRHHYVVVFDKDNPQKRLLLDTHASTLNGNPTSIPLNFSLHSVVMDRSGRYVQLRPTWVDMAAPRKAAQAYLWDTVTGGFTEFGASAHPYGHDVFGYGVSVNQDCCVSTTWDAAQWQLRNLTTPLVSRDLITNVLSPKQVYLADHTTWNNAKPDRLVPVVSALYRAPTSETAWRAWDDEIVAIQTDAAAGADAIVWRFAHHRSDVRSDVNAMGISFWYQPHPNVSPDGRWVLFTSNWEKTLGTDLTADSATRARQDVFLVELKSATPPVVLGATSLPSGRATVPYSAALYASGGVGAFAWTVSAGELPAGLSLDSSTGVISGTPTTQGQYTFTVTVADPDEAGINASGSATISIGATPVAVGEAALARGRMTVPYAAALQASGGSGAFTWTVSAGSLPAGLSLDASTGVISGTPAAHGEYIFTVTVADANEAINAASGSVALSIAPSPVAFAAQALPRGRITVPYAAALQASGGSGAFMWSVTAGSVPAGLSLDAATGALTGTPLATGAYSFTVSVADAAEAANAATADVSIAIADAPVSIATASLPDGRQRVKYAASLKAVGGSGAVVWAIAPGMLPSGLSLNAANGAISGVPSVAGSFPLVVTATDVADPENTVSAELAIVLAPAVKVSSPRRIPEATSGTWYTYQVEAANVVGTAKWNLQGGSMPPGMSLSATGVISGTCYTKGTYYFNARVRDLNTDDTLTLTLVVK